MQVGYSKHWHQIKISTCIQRLHGNTVKGVNMNKLFKYLLDKTASSSIKSHQWIMEETTERERFGFISGVGSTIVVVAMFIMVHSVAKSLGWVA